MPIITGALVTVAKTENSGDANNNLNNTDHGSVDVDVRRVVGHLKEGVFLSDSKNIQIQFV